MRDITPEQALASLKQGTVDIFQEDKLLEKLKQNRPLRIKLGADPTAPDLHLGHAVVLSKLKQFQDMGHEVIFLIGDFTARIGDPSGRLKTRPPLTTQEIAQNTTTYFEQVKKILNPKRVRIRFNSEWLDSLSLATFTQLCSQLTLARLTEREDFAQRIKKQQPISFHELLYPIFQAYDSVALKADVELGGTDQTVNLLTGRFLQEQLDQEPQIVMTMPLLEGLDGDIKMSKSAHNYIGLAEPAEQAYGKLMSISDKLMWRYMHLLLKTSEDEISSLQERIAYGSAHPMALKKNMAYEIIEKFWSKDEANHAQYQFEALFERKDYSSAQQVTLPTDTANPIKILTLLSKLDAIETNSQGRRLIAEGAVKVNEQKITNVHAEITWEPGTIIKVGKHRIYRLA